MYPSNKPILHWGEHRSTQSPAPVKSQSRSGETPWRAFCSTVGGRTVKVEVTSYYSEAQTVKLAKAELFWLKQ